MFFYVCIIIFSRPAVKKYFYYHIYLVCLKKDMPGTNQKRWYRAYLFTGRTLPEARPAKLLFYFIIRLADSSHTLSKKSKFFFAQSKFHHTFHAGFS